MFLLISIVYTASYVGITYVAADMLLVDIIVAGLLIWGLLNQRKTPRTAVSVAPSRLYRIIDVAGLSFILFFCTTGILAVIGDIVDGVSLYNSVTNIVAYPFIPHLWPVYAPLALLVIEFAAIYFVFYGKFTWRSPFIFLVVWSFSELSYNFMFITAHLQVLFAGQLTVLYPDGAEIFLAKMALYVIAFVVGLVLLRPIKLDWSFSFVKYAAILIIVVETAYNYSIGFPLAAVNYTTIGYLLSFVGNIVTPTIFYTVIKPLRPVARPASP